MDIRRFKHTPDFIEKLSRCEIFVFGSNLEGKHGGGAARIAHKKFGAEWGVGDGPTGRCYAIPTMHGGLEEIRPYAEKFIEYAKEHPMNRFLLTRVGCGIAGFKDTEISELFLEALNIPNISLPKKWISILIDSWKQPKKTIAPRVLNESILKRLCDEYRYNIGSGVTTNVPEISIRYVVEEKKFQHVRFGDFFFYGNDFYVWTLDDKWATEHEQNIVMDLFHDECEGRGYARKVIFAGVHTGVRDCKNEIIHTGDVISIRRNNEDRIGYQFALGTFDNEEENEYRFILDNHCITLSECIANNYKLKRIGTVFFKLDNSEQPKQTIAERTCRFNNQNNNPEHRRLKFIMSQYTPSFEQEDWKYASLKVLGVEYNWR